MRIELSDIHKHYGQLRANDGVSLTVAEGAIHGILGENGAGKSTLMKILSGFSRKTSGVIRIDGNPVSYATPAEAAKLGIGMLYQEPRDFPAFDVLDNFLVGRRSRRRMSRNRQIPAFRELADSFGFSLHPAAAVNRLTVGERQQLEMIRLLSMGVSTLIFDEPTTGISSQQKAALFGALRKLAEEGRSILLVSHKLEDVQALCDRVTVLRRGRVAGAMERPFDTDRLLDMMFGEPPAHLAPAHAALGKPELVLENVSARGGRTGLHSCSTVVHAGEVVGLAGLEGSGQGLFLRAVAGLIPVGSGRIRFGGRDMTGAGYHACQSAGAAFLPASRLEEGLISGLTLTEHFALVMGGRLRIRQAEARRRAVAAIDGFQIKGVHDSRVEALSGGNQQRLLLSFLPENPALLLLENPTRGLDVESSHWVWTHLQGYAARNKAIVFSSSELDEIVSVADTVKVFFEGRIILDVRTRDTDTAALGRAIAGKVP